MFSLLIRKYIQIILLIYQSFSCLFVSFSEDDIVIIMKYYHTYIYFHLVTNAEIHLTLNLVILFNLHTINNFRKYPILRLLVS